MKHHAIRCSLVGAFALAFIATPMLAAAAPGDMLHVTTTTKTNATAHGTAPTTSARVKIPDTAYQSASASMDVCTSRQHDAREIAKSALHQKECVFSDYKQIRDTISFHETCTDALQSNGDASFVIQPGGSIHGTIHLEGKSQGHRMTKDLTYDGVVTGSCDYKPPRTAQ